MTSKLLVRFTLIFSVVGFIDLSWASKTEETPFERQTQKIIALLKNGKMTDDGAFLKRGTGDDDPLKTFQDYCNMFIDLPELKEASKPWKVHLSAFAYLANAFFDYASSPNKKGEEHYWEALSNDIKERQEKKTAHYSWFMHFIDALNIIRTPKEERAKHHDNNTRFDTHHVAVVNQLLKENKGITPDLYKAAVKAISGYATRKMATTAALARQFPQIVEFPFPYDLSDRDIVFTFPKPVLREQPANHSWFQGFAKKTIHADGYDMTIPEFGKHDKLHHAIIRAALSILTTNDYTKNPHYYSKETLPLLGSMRTLFFQWLDVCQLLIAEKEQTLNQTTDSLKREGLRTEVRLTTFLTFYIFHESRIEVQKRLKQIVKPIAYSKDDKNYYGDLYPTSWRSRSVEENVKAINDYDDRQFKPDITRIAQQYYPQEDLKDRTMEALNQAEKLNLRETLFDPSLYKVHQAVERFMGESNGLPLLIKYWSPDSRHYNEDNTKLGNLYRFFCLDNFVETPQNFSFQEWVVERERFRKLNTSFLLMHFPFFSSAIDDAGNTALHLAVNFGIIDKVEELVKLIPIDTPNKMGETPLDLAVAFNDQEIIKILWKEAKKNKVNIYSNPQTMKTAIMANNKAVVCSFLNHEFNPNYKDDNGYTLLFLAGIIYSHFDILNLLLKHGADMTLPNKYGRSFLTLIGVNNKLDIYQHVEKKIKSLDNNHGIDLLTHEDKSGYTLLISVFFNDSSLVKKEKFIEYLLSQGADVNYKSKSYGYNVIHLLIMNHRNEELKWLLKRKDRYKLDINQSCQGYTPLWQDLDHNNGANIPLLLEHGADPSLTIFVRNNHEESLWDALVQKNLKEPLIAVLQSKSKWDFPQVITRDNKLFFLDYCYQNGFLEQGVEILRFKYTRWGVVGHFGHIKTWSYDPSTAPQDAMPPLEYALRQGYIGVMKDLVRELESEKLFNARNRKEESLLDIAIQLNNQEAVDFIQGRKKRIMANLRLEPSLMYVPLQRTPERMWEYNSREDELLQLELQHTLLEYHRRYYDLLKVLNNYQ